MPNYSKVRNIKVYILNNRVNDLVFKIMYTILLALVTSSILFVGEGLFSPKVNAQVYSEFELQKDDTDGDGVLNIYEDVNMNGDLEDDDTDEDGIPNYLDDDDDGDLALTIDEDINRNGDPEDDDTDNDLIPNYLDTDDDGDEKETIDEDVNGNEILTDDDSDSDKVPDYLDYSDDSPLFPDQLELYYLSLTPTPTPTPRVVSYVPPVYTAPVITTEPEETPVPTEVIDNANIEDASGGVAWVDADENSQEVEDTYIYTSEEIDATEMVVTTETGAISNPEDQVIPEDNQGAPVDNNLVENIPASDIKIITPRNLMIASLSVFFILLVYLLIQSKKNKNPEIDNSHDNDLE